MSISVFVPAPAVTFCTVILPASGGAPARELPRHDWAAAESWLPLGRGRPPRKKMRERMSKTTVVVREIIGLGLILSSRFGELLPTELQ